MPGMFISICGEAEGCGVADDDGCGELVGICIPCIFISIFCLGAFFDRDEARADEGIFIPFMFIPRIPPLLRASALFLAARLDLDLELLLDLPIFMPRISCICARMGKATLKRRLATASAHKLALAFSLKVLSLRMIIP